MNISYSNLRVFNLEESINFYQEVLGLQVVKRMENEEYQYSLAWLGFGPESKDICLELTYNWDKRHYEHGSYFGQLVFIVEDVYAATKKAEQRGAKVIRPAGPLKGGQTIISFIEDPDGYRVEFVANN